ncbi:hypothetical protein BDV36DRAFT_267099 [Aspergillus pseudocaelatus]|uniref:Secreted protein n=1 Tax=Aspergillus pseudocaelatus TaxID=1825620 RepID=A0ABQ6W9W0_9EURO|nr:hypothetical protein BDV36DRAFT_267099 [Aspergillus pseudocaelatus]
MFAWLHRCLHIWGWMQLPLHSYVWQWVNYAEGSRSGRLIPREDCVYILYNYTRFLDHPCHCLTFSLFSFFYLFNLF